MHIRTFAPNWMALFVKGEPKNAKTGRLIIILRSIDTFRFERVKMTREKCGRKGGNDDYQINKTVENWVKMCGIHKP